MEIAPVVNTVAIARVVRRGAVLYLFPVTTITGNATRCLYKDIAVDVSAER